jgi:hypothetical protein
MEVMRTTLAKDEPKKVAARWNAVTGFYSGRYMRVGLSTIEERMNWLAMRQTAERRKFRKRDVEQSRKFASVEQRVITCNHNWQPVHKWLHKEYMHCIKCGAIKHQDGTIWFFVDHEPIKLVIRGS